MSFAEIFTLENKELDNLILYRGEDKISTELEGETVILYPASGVYSGLDEVGTTIWNLLEQPKRFRVELVPPRSSLMLGDIVLAQSAEDQYVFTPRCPDRRGCDVSAR